MFKVSWISISRKCDNDWIQPNHLCFFWLSLDITEASNSSIRRSYILNHKHIYLILYSTILYNIFCSANIVERHSLLMQHMTVTWEEHTHVINPANVGYVDWNFQQKLNRSCIVKRMVMSTQYWKILTTFTCMLRYMLEAPYGYI